MTPRRLDFARRFRPTFACPHNQFGQPVLGDFGHPRFPDAPADDGRTIFDGGPGHSEQRRSRTTRSAGALKGVGSRFCAGLESPLRSRRKPWKLSEACGKDPRPLYSGRDLFARGELR